MGYDCLVLGTKEGKRRRKKELQSLKKHTIKHMHTIIIHAKHLSSKWQINLNLKIEIGYNWKLYICSKQKVFLSITYGTILK